MKECNMPEPKAYLEPSWDKNSSWKDFIKKATLKKHFMKKVQHEKKLDMKRRKHEKNVTRKS